MAHRFYSTGKYSKGMHGEVFKGYTRGMDGLSPATRSGYGASTRNTINTALENHQQILKITSTNNNTTNDFEKYSKNHKSGFKTIVYMLKL